MLKVIDIGETVLCDSCNKNYSESDQQGGVLFGSKAYCPDCVPELEASVKKYEEERYIKGRCPEGMSYKDWVLSLRGGDNTIKIYS